MLDVLLLLHVHVVKFLQHPCSCRTVIYIYHILSVKDQLPLYLLCICYLCASARVDKSIRGRFRKKQKAKPVANGPVEGQQQQLPEVRVCHSLTVVNLSTCTLCIIILFPLPSIRMPLRLTRRVTASDLTLLPPSAISLMNLSLPSTIQTVTATSLMMVCHF